MLKVPHRLVEGCLIAAHAIQSKQVYIYIRGEYEAEYRSLQGAVDEARDAGILGDVGSSSTAAPAPTSAVRRRHCSSPSRASAGSRAPSRRSRRSPASTPRRP